MSRENKLLYIMDEEKEQATIMDEEREQAIIVIKINGWWGETACYHNGSGERASCIIMEEEREQAIIMDDKKEQAIVMHEEVIKINGCMRRENRLS